MTHTNIHFSSKGIYFYIIIQFVVHDSITLHIDTSSKVKYDKICMLTSNAEIYPGKKNPMTF